MKVLNDGCFTADLFSAGVRSVCVCVCVRVVYLCDGRICFLLRQVLCRKTAVCPLLGQKPPTPGITSASNANTSKFLPLQKHPGKMWSTLCLRITVFIY